MSVTQWQQRRQPYLQLRCRSLHTQSTQQRLQMALSSWDTQVLPLRTQLIHVQSSCLLVNLYQLLFNGVQK